MYTWWCVSGYKLWKYTSFDFNFFIGMFLVILKTISGLIYRRWIFQNDQLHALFLHSLPLDMLATLQECCFFIWLYSDNPISFTNQLVMTVLTLYPFVFIVIPHIIYWYNITCTPVLKNRAFSNNSRFPFPIIFCDSICSIV